MTNNDTLRSLRYALDLNDATTIAIFALAQTPMTRARLAKFFRREDEEDYEELPDDLLACFLDGLVIQRRGSKDAPKGARRPAPMKMTNNRVLRSIRIALELKDQAMIDILALADVKISKGELNALFRRSDHTNYRECGNQFLRNFLRGLTTHLRGRSGA